MTRRASSGTQLPQSPLGDSKVVNDILDCTEAWKRTQALGRGVGEKARGFTTDVIHVVLASGSDLARGSVVEVGAKLTTDMDYGQLYYGCNVPTCDAGFVENGLAILLRPLKYVSGGGDPDEVPAQVSGAVIARVAVTDVAHRYATVTCGSSVLQSGDGGQFEIISPAGSTGIQELVVVFTYQDRYVGVTTEEIPFGGSGSVSRLNHGGSPTGITDIVHSWCNEVGEDKQVRYSRSGKRFYIDEQEC